jgi:hypothetical protein
VIAWWQKRSSEQATLFTSGLIAGDALMGIGIAILVVSGVDQHLALRSLADAGLIEGVFTVVPFALVAWWLTRMTAREQRS